MVRNPEKKMTRKIHKNRRTRKRNVGRIRTKIWRNRMYKTMKGGGLKDKFTALKEKAKSLKRIGTVRDSLNPANSDIGYNIEYSLNRLAKKMNEFAELVANDQCYMDFWNEHFKDVESRKSFTQAYNKKTEEKIPFIPISFSEIIDPTIKTLIDSIKTAYNKRYNSYFKLTSVDFNEKLDHVCKGEIYKKVRGRWLAITIKSNLPYVNLQQSLFQLCETIDPSRVGWSPASFQLPKISKKTPIFSINIAQVLWRWESDDGTKYNDFSGEHCRLLEQAFNSGQHQFQIPQMQWVFDFGNMIQSKIGGTDRKIVRIDPPPAIKNLKETYKKLNRFFDSKELLLDPEKIKCMACMIVMPNGKRMENAAMDEYGRDYGYKYFDFTNKIWGWDVIKQELEPNMYCAKRVLGRTIGGEQMDKKNITKLRYTMSPIIIPQELANTNLKTCQNIQDEVLSHLLLVAQTIEATNEQERSSMKKKFEGYEEITFTQILSSDPKADPINSRYIFYELKIYKKKLTYDRSNVFDVVIVDFKAFSEDGICGKEAIFVSYLHVQNADFPPELHLPGQLQELHLPGQPQELHLPGQPQEAHPIILPVKGRDEKTAKKEIIEMFEKKFIDLLIKLSVDNAGLIDRVILPLKTQGGFFADRGYTSMNATAAISSSENPFHVHHIFLTQPQNGMSYQWQIKTATMTQIIAFNAVQGYMKNKDNKWIFENGQNTFVVTNKMDDKDEIKVIVTVKELKDQTTDELKIVEYQAESAPTYLLFAGESAAQEYIEKKMGFIKTNTQAQGGLSALPQAQGGLSAPLQAQGGSSALPPPPSTSSALPTGWIKQFDSKSQTPFYVYTPTNHSQWYPPPPS